MERYIKGNVSDITYKSELNSPKQLTLFLKKNFRKLWAH